jgi:heme exporter protein D
MAEFYVLAPFLVVVLAIVWLILPLAIFGTKPLLRELLAEQQRTNQLLAELTSRAQAQAVQSQPHSHT